MNPRDAIDELIAALCLLTWVFAGMPFVLLFVRILPIATTESQQ